MLLNKGPRTVQGLPTRAIGIRLMLVLPKAALLATIFIVVLAPLLPPILMIVSGPKAATLDGRDRPTVRVLRIEVICVESVVLTVPVVPAPPSHVGKPTNANTGALPHRFIKSLMTFKLDATPVCDASLL